MTRSSESKRNASARLSQSVSGRALIIALAGFALLAVPGCSKISNVRASFSDVTGSTSQPLERLPDSELAIQQHVSKWSRRYDKNSNDKMTARNFARALRAARRSEQALAVLQKAVIRDPKDNALLADYGKTLADMGRFSEAAQALERAQIPESPSWTILSAQGSVADQMGQNALAQQYYQQALKIAPGEPSVLSNLGLSYALSKQLPQAEKTLRQAAAHPKADGRVLQNLSLILALQGKFAEAEAMQRQVLSATDASANITSIRRMIAQSNTWREISAAGQSNGRKQR